MSFSKNAGFKKILGFSILFLFILISFSYFPSAASESEISGSQNNYILPFTEDLQTILQGKQLLLPALASASGELKGKMIGVLCRAKPEKNNKITAVEESCIPHELLEELDKPNFLSCLTKLEKSLDFYLFGEKCEAKCIIDPRYGIEVNGQLSAGLTVEIAEGQRHIAAKTSKNCISDYSIITTMRDDRNGKDLFYLVPCEEDENKPKVKGVTNFCVYRSSWKSFLHKLKKDWYPEKLVLEIHEDLKYVSGGVYERKISIPSNAKFFSQELGSPFESQFYISGENNAIFCKKEWCLKTFLNEEGKLNAVLMKVASLTPGNQLSVTSYTNIP